MSGRCSLGVIRSSLLLATPLNWQRKPLSSSAKDIGRYEGEEGIEGFQIVVDVAMAGVETGLFLWAEVYTVDASKTHCVQSALSDVGWS